MNTPITVNASVATPEPLPASLTHKLTKIVGQYDHKYVKYWENSNEKV